MPRCSKCPVPGTPVAESASVERTTDDFTWRLMSPQEPVHLAVLFRDPAIKAGRPVPRVLDLKQVDGRLIAGSKCWVRDFLRSVGPFPEGFRAALDNGVRCPCPTSSPDYRARVRVCWAQTRLWLGGLRHFDGGPPGVVICDRSLADALSHMGVLSSSNSSPWRCPAPFIRAVGQFVICLGRKALIGPHPIMVTRSKAYREALAESDFAKRVRALARLPN
jgi:hypothetical protein